MRARKLLVIFILLWLTIHLTTESRQYHDLFNDSLDYQDTAQNGDTINLNYFEHPPINIINDSDFANQAAGEGWLGNGSEENPYVISNYIFSLSSYNLAINVTTFNMSYIIENNFISGDPESSLGILILGNYNNMTIVIRNNTIERVYNGIRSNVNNLRIEKNKLVDQGLAIWFSNGMNSSITENTFSKISLGIQLSGNSYTKIIRNKFMNSGGIYIDKLNNKLNLIKANIFKGWYYEFRGLFGIIMWNGENNSIVRNIFFSFYETAIVISGQHYGFHNITMNIIVPLAKGNVVGDYSISSNPIYWEKNLYEDYDGSGKYQIHGDRNSVDKNPLPLNHDFDGDKVSDIEELYFKTDPFNGSDYEIPTRTKTEIVSTTITKIGNLTETKTQTREIASTKEVTVIIDKNYSQIISINDPELRLNFSNYLFLLVSLTTITLLKSKSSSRLI